MEPSYVYECKITNYLIKYIKYQDGYLVESIYVHDDYKNIKALMSLIRNSIDDLTNKNVRYIYQYIYENEWMQFLKNKTTWEIIEKSEICLIKCDISDFIKNYAIGIGF
jgi:hypothetical protein